MSPYSGFQKTWSSCFSDSGRCLMLHWRAAARTTTRLLSSSGEWCCSFQFPKAKTHLSPTRSQLAMRIAAWATFPLPSFSIWKCLRSRFSLLSLLRTNLVHFCAIWSAWPKPSTVSIFQILSVFLGLWFKNPFVVYQFIFHNAFIGLSCRIKFVNMFGRQVWQPTKKGEFSHTWALGLIHSYLFRDLISNFTSWLSFLTACCTSVKRSKQSHQLGSGYRQSVFCIYKKI